MNFLKKFLVGLLSAIFLLSISSAAFADPIVGDDDDPMPPPIMPDEG